jgi:hypothetical protein
VMDLKILLIAILAIVAGCAPVLPSGQSAVQLVGPKWSPCIPESPYGYKCIAVAPNVSYTGVFQVWEFSDDCKQKNVEVSVTDQLNGPVQVWHQRGYGKLPASSNRCAGMRVPVDCLGLRWDSANPKPGDSEWLTVSFEDKDVTTSVADHLRYVTGITVEVGTPLVPTNTSCPTSRPSSYLGPEQGDIR